MIDRRARLCPELFRYSLSFFGEMPVGALWAGAVADVIGAPLTIVAGAAVSLPFAALFWLLAPELRRLP